jgi:class 3 adenylate cyclase
MEKQSHKGVYQTFQKMDTADYMVAFSGLSKNYCIGIVDMVESTKISAEMNEIEWCKYYEIFLNSMAKILPRFGGAVIKNQGDSLLYYFPESSKGTKYGFMSCIECSLSLTEEHDVLCEILKKEGLPCLNYRVSADYGKVVIMKSNNSTSPVS